MNVGAEEPTAIKNVGNEEGNLGNNSITLSKRGGDFGKSLLLENTGVSKEADISFMSKEADISSSGHGGHGDQFNPVISLMT